MNIWSLGEIFNYGRYGLQEMAGSFFGNPALRESGAKGRLAVAIKAHKGIRLSAEIELREKMLEADTEKFKGQKAADFRAFQEVNKIENSTYKELIAARIAARTSVVLQKNALDRQADSLSTQQELTDHQKIHFTASKKVLTATHEAQKEVASVQKEVNDLQKAVDSTRMEIAEQAATAAQEHMTAIAKVQGSELGTFQTDKDTQVASLRHDFAMQIIGKVADFEMQKIRLEGQRDALQAKGKFDTQANKLKIAEDLDQVTAAKEQYIDGLKAKLSTEELEAVTGYMADQMSAETFARVQDQRVERRGEQLSAVKKGVEKASTARVLETDITTQESANTAEEVALAALKNDIRIQLCENFSQEKSTAPTIH